MMECDVIGLPLGMDFSTGRVEPLGIMGTGEETKNKESVVTHWRWVCQDMHDPVDHSGMAPRPSRARAVTDFGPRVEWDNAKSMKMVDSTPPAETHKTRSGERRRTVVLVEGALEKL